MEKSRLRLEIERLIEEFNNPASTPERCKELLEELFKMWAIDAIVVYGYCFAYPSLEKLQSKEQRAGARPRYAVLETSTHEERETFLVLCEQKAGSRIDHDCIALSKITLGVDLLFDSTEGGIFLLKMTVK